MSLKVTNFVTFKFIGAKSESAETFRIRVPPLDIVDKAGLPGVRGEEVSQ